MKRVQRTDIVDYVTWTDQRPAILEEMFEIKRQRRIHVGDHLTLLFENTDTIRYQIQEMMRVERMVREKDIQHEIDTYNEVLGGPGGLGCTLLIEIDDRELRDVKLREWLNLPDHLYALSPSGEKIRPRYDPRQKGEDRVSSVQYLQFDLGGRAPVALGCDLPTLTIESRLTPEQTAILQGDLDSDPG